MRPSAISGAGRRLISLNSTYILLDHAQVNPEPMEVDLKRGSNLQCAHGGLDLGEPGPMLGQQRFVLALRDLALEPAQRPMQSDDTTNSQPMIKARCKADGGDKRRDDGDDEEQNTVKKRGEPERRVPLPERRARAVEALCGQRERQIVGLLGGKLTEPIERPWRRVNFANRFQ